VADAEDVSREVFIQAPPAVVFGFLTNSEKLLRWMGTSADIQPVPGGRFRMSPNGREIVEGRFLEVVPHRRIVFTWGFVGADAQIPAGSTTVEITLTAKRGGTWLRLRHRGLPSGEPRTGHGAGWIHYLERLRTVAEGRLPGPDSLAAGSVQHG
jgi:uncharacterized protein YndB with AHSA1/START domain